MLSGARFSTLSVCLKLIFCKLHNLEITFCESRRSCSYIVGIRHLYASNFMYFHLVILMIRLSKRGKNITIRMVDWKRAEVVSSGKLVRIAVGERVEHALHIILAIVEIMWGLLQMFPQMLSSQQRPSSLPCHACQMGLGGSLWAEASQLQWKLLNFFFSFLIMREFIWFSGSWVWFLPWWWLSMEILSWRKPVHGYAAVLHFGRVGSLL